MCLHRHMSIEVWHICLHMFLYVFLKCTVWVDLLYRYERVKVKESFLVKNLSSNQGEKEYQSVKFISLCAYFFRRIVVLLKANLHEQKWAEFWWWYFWHIHTFNSATSFNDSGRCKAVNYSYCDVIFHTEVSLLLLRWFWEITSVLFLFSFCLCLLYVSGSRFSSLNINAWKYLFAFFWHEICLTSQGPHALRKNLCKSYSLCVCAFIDFFQDIFTVLFL